MFTRFHQRSCAPAASRRRGRAGLGMDVGHAEPGRPVQSCGAPGHVSQPCQRPWAAWEPPGLVPPAVVKADCSQLPA